MPFFIYIVANKRNGTLYIGHTDDLMKRAWQHKQGVIEGFTRDYGVKILVWYEVHNSRESALLHERRMKRWNRAWKLELIEKHSPDWRDLAEDLSS